MKVMPDFRVYDKNAGIPTVKINDAKISFNKDCTEHLNRPEKVLVMINEKAKKIAIVADETSDKRAISYYPWKDQRNHTVRWNNLQLINEICHMCGWNVKENTYTAYGKYVDGENAVIFDMNNFKKN